MIRPNIKAYHEDLRIHRIHPNADHMHFLGKNALDLRRETNNTVHDIERDKITFQMEIAMPGFSKEEVIISVKQDILTIRGKKKKEKKLSSKFLVKEFDVDIVERKFQLEEDLLNDKARATFKDGMVHIYFTSILQKGRKTARKIPIE